jgi:hypothetical protein
MQNGRVKILGMALAGLLLISTWALAAAESAGTVAAQRSSTDIQKGTITLQVDNMHQLTAALLENDAVHVVVNNPKRPRAAERQAWLDEREERLLRMQCALPPYSQGGLRPHH